MTIEELKSFTDPIIKNDEIASICYIGNNYSYQSGENSGINCQKSSLKSSHVLDGGETISISQSVSSKTQSGIIILFINLNQILSKINSYNLKFQITEHTNSDNDILDNIGAGYDRFNYHLIDNLHILGSGNLLDFTPGYSIVDIGVFVLALLSLILITYIMQILITRDETISTRVKEQEQLILKQQQYLIAQEKVASLGTLTAGVAHEIRNPLHIIKNSILVFETFFRNYDISKIKDIVTNNSPELEYLQEDYLELETCMNFIQKNTDRADKVISSMLGLGGNSSKELLTSNNLNEVISETITLVNKSFLKRTSRTVKIVENYDPNIENILFYKIEFSRAIINLMDNALYAAETNLDQAMPKVEITTKKLSRTDEIEISINDNGSGIPEDMKTKIIEPFITTKPPSQGTGLGLALVSDIMNKHQGRLEIESQLGHGSSFKLIIPIKYGEPNEAK